MDSVATRMLVLEGAGGRLVFSHNVELLKSGQYRLAGQLVQWSISNGGPGLPLSRYTYNSLLGRSVTDPQQAIQDVTDHTLCQVVDEVGKHTLLCNCTNSLVTYTVNVAVCTGLLGIIAARYKVVNFHAVKYTPICII